MESGWWIDSRLPPTRFSPLEVQTHLAILSMSFLLLDDYEKMHNMILHPTTPLHLISLSNSLSQSKKSELSSLSAYALSYWLVHVERSGEHNDIYELVRSLSTKRNYNLLGRKYAVGRTFICESGDEFDSFLLFSIQAGIPWIVVRILGDFPEKINNSLGDHGSPLIFASRFDCPDMIHALLDIGADINLATPVDVENLSPFLDSTPVITPLLMSILVDRFDNFNILIKRDADVHALVQPSLMWSTLHAAAYSGASKILDTLLKLGVNPNVINYCGEAPLHIAVLRNNPRSVELLISAGADPLLQAGSGINPLQLAICRPYSSVSDFLLEMTQYHSAFSHIFDINQSSHTLWLGSFPRYPLHHSIVRLRWSGTCEWIIKNEAYKRWESSHGILWLQGPCKYPICKRCTSQTDNLFYCSRSRQNCVSVSNHCEDVRILLSTGTSNISASYSSTIINNLMIQGDIVLFHYFEKNSSSMRIDTFFKSLIIQLLLSVPPRYAENISRSRLNDLRHHTFELVPELVRSIITTAATQLRRHIFIIVDALDRYFHRDDLFSHLGEFERMMGVSVLVTSQKHWTTKRSYHNPQCLSMAEERATINLELKRYLSGQLLDYNNSQKFSESLRSKMTDTILDRADGM